jgi:hypothetical protein
MWGCSRFQFQKLPSKTAGKGREGDNNHNVNSR